MDMRGKILKIQVSTKLLYWPFCLQQILKEIEKNLFENKDCGLQFVNRYLSKINISRVSYQGELL